jgi:O-antigen/teichoic acid export membrane protein
MKHFRKVVLFLLLMVPFVVLYFVWGQGLRLATIILAFVAMWSLWVARRERKHLWTSKMHDIWAVQILWCFAAVEGNSELFYRHVRPTLAILLVDFILCLCIRGVFKGER